MSKETPDLRGLFLTTRATDAGVSSSAALPNVWAGMMELAFPNATASLVCIADGTASLYLSTGGGVIGGHAHEKVRAAAKSFVLALETALESLQPATAFPFPKPGTVAVVARTYVSDRRADVSEKELESGRHPLSAVFFAGHDVIAEIRTIAQRN